MKDQIDKEEGEEEEKQYSLVQCWPGSNTWVKSTVYTDPFKHHQSSLARRGVIYVTVCQRKLGSPARCVVKHDGAGQCTNSGGLVPRTPASLCFAVP